MLVGVTLSVCCVTVPKGDEAAFHVQSRYSLVTRVVLVEFFVGSSLNSVPRIFTQGSEFEACFRPALEFVSETAGEERFHHLTCFGETLRSCPSTSSGGFFLFFCFSLSLAWFLISPRGETSAGVVLSNASSLRC